MKTLYVDMAQILLFYVTHPSEEHARTLCHQLIQEKLIACSNVFPMDSQYTWQNALCHEAELVSILKTDLTLEAEVELRISEIHTYEVPCIIRYNVKCNEAYANWIYAETVGQRKKNDKS